MTQITDSQFHMWRAIFALAHADDIVTDDEIKFMVDALDEIPFNTDQRRALVDDIAAPQDIEEMFLKISDVKDKADFFDFARKMVWADGDFGRAEQAVILKLKETHVQSTDVDSLVGSVDLEFEEDKPESVREAVFSFRDHFLRGLFGR